MGRAVVPPRRALKPVGIGSSFLSCEIDLEVLRELGGTYR